MDELLVRVTVLEGTQGNTIKIPDILAPIPIPPPESNLLVKIVDVMDDKVAQVITKDWAEGQMLQVEGEEVRVLGIEGEIFKEGEDMLDILKQVVVRDQ